MNGAAAVLERKIRTPSSSMTITIGASHHFLFWARNAQNSLARLSPWTSAAAFSNSLGLGGVVSFMGIDPKRDGADRPLLELPEVAPHVGGDRLGGPVGFDPPAPGALERVTADDAEDQGDRRE